MNKNLLILDCDGVLTPKKRYYSEDGRFFKPFNSDDSYALKNIKNLGIDTIILTADEKGFLITAKRASDWGIKAICTKEKQIETKKLTQEYKETYFVGDGPEDIVVIDLVNIFFAPSDARLEVQSNVNEKIVILKTAGGEGVLDEVINYLRVRKL